MLSRCITPVRSLIKTTLVLGSIALLATSVAPALAATTDPLQVLYIFPGARDDGGANGSGLATTVHCFSFSPNAEIIQYVVRDNGGR